MLGKCHLGAASFQKLTNSALSKEIRNWKQKFFLKSRVFRSFFSENSTETFFMPAKGQINNAEMLKFIGRHALEEVFQVMRVAVNYRKGQKQLKINALHLKRTSARPPIYDRAYPETTRTASSGNQVGVTNPMFSLLLYSRTKSLWKSQVFREPIF